MDKVPLNASIPSSTKVVAVGLEVFWLGPVLGVLVQKTGAMTVMCLGTVIPLTSTVLVALRSRRATEGYSLAAHEQQRYLQRNCHSEGKCMKSFKSESPQALADDSPQSLSATVPQVTKPEKVPVHTFHCGDDTVRLQPSLAREGGAPAGAVMLSGFLTSL